MKRDNGAVLAIGALAAFSALAELSRRRRQGSGNDDAELVEAELVEVGYPLARREPGPVLAQMQLGGERGRRAEIDMPDRELARRVYSGGDALGGMPFEEAVNHDPRRIDGLIAQRFDAAFGPILGPGQPETYARVMSDLRANAGGHLTASVLTDFVERTLDESMLRMLPHLPPQARDEMRRRLPTLGVAFGEAADIARRAGMVATRPEDRRAWTGFAEYLEGHPEQLRIALTAALPDRAPMGRGMMMGRGPRRLNG
jgi:hypothetical protein